MIVCICKAVSDKRIRHAANEGVVTLRELSRELGLGTCCGKCVPQAREILANAMPSQPVQMAGMMGLPATA
ncbi:MAG: (2Fe-2S)-binding protein [Panacagrimonas sp.]|jgi:bacterioferritin-associated ferredoxin|nr:(2Fe-2S)-binding protein [Panacagrimonas sp.]MCC2655512.1 (2Fe-2S)-binding protein [Panacagrimonas sp.]